MNTTFAETRETILPKDRAAWLEARTPDITSTEVACLFGLSPYETLFGLWHRKRGRIVQEFEPDARMRWGTRLQDSIAIGVCEDNGWQMRAKSEYVRIPSLRLGASFDYEVRIHVGGGCVEVAILEVKNVDALRFRDAWLVDEDGEVEAPEHIELQVQHQMLVDGADVAYIAALIGGNDVKLIRRQANPSIQARIVDAAAAFWRSIEANQPPPPDYARDLDILRRLNGYADPGKFADLTKDAKLAGLCRQYQSASRAAKDAEEDRKVLGVRILEHIGDRETVLADGFKISAGMVGPAEIAAHTRAGYRNMHLYARKETSK